MKEDKMSTVKELSGRLLLFLYKLQREGEPLTCQIQWHNKEDWVHSGKKMESNNQLLQRLLRVVNGSENDLYNALKYLEEKKFIDLDYVSRGSMVGPISRSFRVTASGTDIIEGIEQDDGSRQKFHSLFNIIVNVDNVESLIKSEIKPALFNL